VIDELTVRSAGRAERTPLETALAATLALLTPAQRETLARFAIFEGPFTRESAVALGGASASVDLDMLLGWSLVTAESRDDLALCRVPEIVRRHLVSAGETPIVARVRHSTWFAERTLAAFHQLTTTEAAEVGRRIDAERADIDAAFEHAIEQGDRASALSIAAGMAWVGLGSGTQASALMRARRAAELPGRAAVAVESQAGLGHGILAYQLGFMDEAATVLDQALTFSQQAQDADLTALSHAFLAYLATLTSGGTRVAIDRMRSARAHLDDASPSTQAMVTLIAAQVERSRGDHERALQFAASARTLAERSGHGWALLMSGVVAAKVRLDARSPREALATLQAVLASPRVLADPISVLITSSVAAGAAAGVGADAAGARIIGAVDSIGPRYGFDPRANEPADFGRYRQRVQQGLTPEQWRDAYAHGTELNLAELIDVTMKLP
jgi:tetratricopeptide (TPR) repeat protein